MYPHNRLNRSSASAERNKIRGKMTAYETKKIIYETIVKEIYINPETAHALTDVIYKNLKDAEQGVHPTVATEPLEDSPWQTGERRAQLSHQPATAGNANRSADER